MAGPRALVADIGGTNMRLAIAEAGRIDPENARSFEVRRFAGPGEVAQRYLADLDAPPPDTACLALAGPVAGRRAPLTNSNWIVDADRFQAETGVGECRLINDFEALAHALPHLGGSDLVTIGANGMRSGREGGARAVIGPGTGLGVALLADDGDRRIAMPGEGGHIGFAPVDEHEIEILRRLAGRYGRVSAERLISGAGLEALHRALGEIDGRPREAMSAAEILNDALERREGPGWETIKIFAAIFGGVAGDIALVAGAVGGVYLAGGISRRLAPVLEETPFRARFDAKGRLANYVSAMPVHAIITDHAALAGAAAALHQQAEKDGSA